MNKLNLNDVITCNRFSLCRGNVQTVSITSHLHFPDSADASWYKSGVCSFALKIEIQAPEKQNTFSMDF